MDVHRADPVWIRLPNSREERHACNRHRSAHALESSFAQLADLFFTGLRRRLFVPDHAADEVEAEFAALRTQLDSRYYPEFCELFAGALSDRLGRDRLDEVPPGLSLEAAQRYLRAAAGIQQELERTLRSLTQKLTAAASRSSCTVECSVARCARATAARSVY
jgi:hypothetical protein